MNLIDMMHAEFTNDLIKCRTCLYSYVYITETYGINVSDFSILKAIMKQLQNSVFNQYNLFDIEYSEKNNISIGDWIIFYNINKDIKFQYGIVINVIKHKYNVQELIIQPIIKGNPVSIIDTKYRYTYLTEKDVLKIIKFKLELKKELKKIYNKIEQ